MCQRRMLKPLWLVPWAGAQGVRVGQGQPYEWLQGKSSEMFLSKAFFSCTNKMLRSHQQHQQNLWV